MIPPTLPPRSSLPQYRGAPPTLPHFGFLDGPADAQRATLDELEIPRVRGRAIAGYEVTGMIGRGGMGVVHRARSIATGRVVALKVLAPERLNDVTASRRLAREGETLERPMPGVVQLVDRGDTQDHGPFVAMELLEGNPLDVLIGWLSAEDAVSYGCQLLRTLAGVHEAGVLHRDIKPANVFVTSARRGGSVKLLDFGLGRPIAGSSTSMLTDPGNAVGTPHYMAPDLLTKGWATPATDTYAAAVVIYEMLTAQLPFEVSSDAPIAVIQNVLRAPRRRVADLCPALSPKLAEVIDRAITPGHEYERAGDLLHAIERATLD